MKNGKNGTNGKNHKIAYIDGVAHQIKSDHTSVLKFVREYIDEKKIPSLCDDPNLAPYGACRVCSVDVALKKDGPTKTVASCHTPVTEGSYIITSNEDLKKFVKTLEKVCIGTVENGSMTKDLAVLVGKKQKYLTTNQFLEVIDFNLKKSLN